MSTEQTTAADELHSIRRYSHNEGIEIHRKSSRPSAVPPIWEKKMSTWFQRWDANGDGKLTRTDFENLDDRLKKACTNCDKNNKRSLFVYLWEHFVSPDDSSADAVVTHEEWIHRHFQAILEWNKNPTLAASLIAIFSLLFDAINTSNDGQICLEEYQAFYSIMGVQVSLAEDAFLKMDTNEDGKLSKEEFLNTVMAYYCELEPNERDLSHTLFLGPLLDSLDPNQELKMHVPSSCTM